MPAKAGKTVKQSGSTSTSGRGRGEFALFALPAAPRCVVSPTDAAGHQFAYQALGGTRAIAPSAHGCPAARQRDSHASRSAEEGPEGGPGVDPHAAEGAARVRGDREGLRHAHGRSEVRAGEG